MISVWFACFSHCSYSWLAITFFIHGSWCNTWKYFYRDFRFKSIILPRMVIFWTNFIIEKQHQIDNVKKSRGIDRIVCANLNFIYIQNARHLGFELSLTYLNSTHLCIKLIRCVYCHEKNGILFLSLLFFFVFIMRKFLRHKASLCLLLSCKFFWLTA